MKKKIFLTTIGSVLFLFPFLFNLNSAAASTVAYSQDSGSSNFGYLWGNISACPTNTRGFYFTPSLTATVSSGDVYVKNAYIGGANGVRFQIYASDGTTLLADTSGTGSSGGYVSFTFSSPITLSSGTNYYFVPSAAGGGGCSPIPSFNSLIGANYAGGSADGYLYYFNTSGLVGTDANYGGTPRFHLYESPAVNSISIAYPSNNSNPSELAYWVVNYSAASSTTYQAYTNPYYTIEITAGNTSSTFEGTQVGLLDLAITTASSATSSQSVPATQAFIPGHTYWAQANLLYTDPWGSGAIRKASSTVISFTVSATTTPAYFLAPSSTASSSAFTMTCDPNSGFFSYSLCYLLQYLFYPTQDPLTALGNLISTISHKPPIGWFNIIVSDLQGINTSSTPAFVVPGWQSVQVGYINPLDEGLGIVIIFLSIMWVYHRARNLKI